MTTEPGRQVSVGALLLFCGILSASARAGEVCVQGTQVRVCVTWSQGSDPIEDVNFRVNFTNPANPDIQLISGDDGWTVHSESVSTGAPANIGSLTIDPSTPAENFKVKVAKASGPGAASVGGIDLTEPGWSGISGLDSGSHITGDVTGRVKVAEGEFFLEIDGDVPSGASIETANLQVLQIRGDLGGEINVTEVMINSEGFGALTVRGAIESTAIITVAAFGEESNIVTLGFGAVIPDFEGQLNLSGGIPTNTVVSIHGLTTSTATIDLNGRDLYGALRLSRGGAARLIGIDGVFGVLNLASLANRSFAGAAEIELIAPTGNVFTLSNSSIDGSLAVESMQGVLSVGGAVGGSIVAGTVDGKAQISVGTNITSSGRIEVTGDLSGDITTNGDVAGEVYVAGNMVYGSSISATGDLTGVIRSDGDCEGDASVAGDVTGDIKVGQLLSRGRVLMDSSCQGMVSIIKKTASSSLIQAAKGLTSTGRIEVNAIGGAHDHDGVIFLGKATSSDPVSIAGQILLLAGTGGGDNNGMINVKGCLTPGTLNLCIGGSNNGSVNISNVCPGTVNWACSGPGQ